MHNKVTHLDTIKSVKEALEIKSNNKSSEKIKKIQNIYVINKNLNSKKVLGNLKSIKNNNDIQNVREQCDKRQTSPYLSVMKVAPEDQGKKYTPKTVTKPQNLAGVLRMSHRKKSRIYNPSNHH